MKGFLVKRRFVFNNPEFLPLLMSYVTWASLIGFVQVLEVILNPIVYNIIVASTATLATVWAYRSRFNFGKGHVRAHFDEIDIFQLPIKAGAKWDCCLEPPTPIEPSAAELQQLGLPDFNRLTFMKELTKKIDENNSHISFEQKRQHHYDNIYTYAMEQNKLKQNQFKSNSDQQNEDDLVRVDSDDDDDADLVSALEIGTENENVILNETDWKDAQDIEE